MATVDEAAKEVAAAVEAARNFMVSEYAERWERAERYMAGETDLLEEEGRSNAVKTEVRDTIRALMPSIMRVLYQARKPIEYKPAKVTDGAFLEQQALFVTQTFNAAGGYMQLYSMVMEALKLNGGPCKTYVEKNPRPRTINMTALTEVEVQELKDMDNVVVDEVTDFEYPKGSPLEGNESGLYNVRATEFTYNGQLIIEAFPMYEFFVSEDANSLETAFVHGHARQVTVAEAEALGLEPPDGGWEHVDTADPEQKDFGGASNAKRGYQRTSDDHEVDPGNKKILLTEAYTTRQMEGDLEQKKYCFWFAGTAYKYLHHEEVDDFCIDLVTPDPVPFAVVGNSIPDLTIEQQDNETSILRAIIDSAHTANNPRVAADPTTTDFSDLMNNVLGAPIKTVGSPALQVFDLPFTGASLMPLLQYMEQDTQNRVGVTKASAGLDPDAMQSTDKNAVMNTIQMAQGVTELMVRNIIETALIPMFRKVLRLSIAHMNRRQVIQTKGEIVPVDLAMFNPDLAAEARVGLGTANGAQKQQTLSFILGKQEQYLDKFGLDNPFTSLSMVYNTIEDLVELGGLVDPGRYFKIITPQIEQLMAQKMAEDMQAEQEAAAANAPMDPSKAMMEIEKGKAAIRQEELRLQDMWKKLDVASNALIKAEENDIKRDTMVQTRMLELAKLGKDRLDSMIEAKQEANNDQRTRVETAAGVGGTPASKPKATSNTGV